MERPALEPRSRSAAYTIYFVAVCLGCWIGGGVAMSAIVTYWLPKYIDDPAVIFGGGSILALPIFVLWRVNTLYPNRPFILQRRKPQSNSDQAWHGPTAVEHWIADGLSLVLAAVVVGLFARMAISSIVSVPTPVAIIIGAIIVAASTWRGLRQPG